MRTPPPFGNLFPYLMVRDAPGLLAFLVNTFDAEEFGRTMRDGALANARVKIGDTAFMVGEASPGMEPAPAALYLFVDDADAVYAKVMQAGATSLYPVSDMPYDDRQGGIRDAWGNLWFISTRLVDGPYTD